MNIIIAGLTAAGKTTHCKLLVSDFAEFGLQYLSASSLLLKEVGESTVKSNRPLDYWISDEALHLGEQRKQDPRADRAVDLELVRVIDSGEKEWVVDALSPAWLSKSPALRIWLESTLESRTMKSIVSYHGTGRYPEDEVRRRIGLKDKNNEEYFKSQYGFDFFTDKRPFDVVIDISEFIKDTTADSSAESIANVQGILRSIVGWKIGLPQYAAEFAAYFRQMPKSVFLRIPKDLLVVCAAHHAE